MFKFSALTVVLVLVALTLTLTLESVAGWHAIRRGFNPRWPCGTYCRYSKCILVNLTLTLTSSTVIEGVLNFICVFVFAVDYKDSDEYPYY
jgi:hypothetical protein